MIVFNQTSLTQYDVHDLTLEDDTYIGQIDKDEDGWWFSPDGDIQYNIDDIFQILNKLKELNAITNSQLDSSEV
jgi:hypothetical protein